MLGSGQEQETNLFQLPYVMVATIALELSFTTHVLSLAEAVAANSHTPSKLRAASVLNRIFRLKRRVRRSRRHQ